VVATVSIVFVRHEGEIRGIETGRPLRHHAHPCNTLDWGRQLLLLASRWLPGHRVIAVADTTYAVIELLAAVRHRLTMVTRLHLDARLFDPPPPTPARRQRPPSGYRTAPADPRAASRRSGQPLAPRCGQPVVWRQ